MFLLWVNRTSSVAFVWSTKVPTYSEIGSFQVPNAPVCDFPSTVSGMTCSWHVGAILITATCRTPSLSRRDLNQMKSCITRVCTIRNSIKQRADHYTSLVMIVKIYSHPMGHWNSFQLRRCELQISISPGNIFTKGFLTGSSLNLSATAKHDRLLWQMQQIFAMRNDKSILNERMEILNMQEKYDTRLNFSRRKIIKETLLATRPTFIRNVWALRKSYIAAYKTSNNIVRLETFSTTSNLLRETFTLPLLIGNRFWSRSIAFGQVNVNRYDRT